MTDPSDQTPNSTDDLAGYAGGGVTTISPSVIITIARLTTLGVAGVSRLTTAPRGARRLPKRTDKQGVVIELRNEAVYADIYIAAQPNLNLRELSRSVQYEVSRAIIEMVGLHVGRINVHIEDIDFPVEI